MSKIITDENFKNMIDNLFSTEECKNSEEGCKKTKEEDDINKIIEPYPIENITEREKNIISLSTDEDEYVDYSEITEECVNTYNDIVTMELAFKIAEEHRWKSSVEADNNNPDLFKKIWEWIKTIFLKIREYLLTVYRKIRVWLTSDMTSIVKWAESNKEDIAKAISANGDITLKIKKPVRNPFTVKINESFINKDFKKAVMDFEKGIVDESILAKIEKFYEKYPTNYFDGIVYGNLESKPEDVTLKEFNKVIKIVDTLTNKSNILKQNLNESITNINEVIANIKEFTKDKNLSNFDTNEISKIKRFASEIQKFYSKNAAALYYKTSVQIRNVMIAKSFAKKALSQYVKE